MIKILGSKTANKIDIESFPMFPFIFVKDKTISPYVEYVNKIYKQQIEDFFGIGLAITIILLFICLGIFGQSLSLFLLLIIPFVLQQIWLIVEWIIKGDLKKVSLIKQGLDLGNEYVLPCDGRTAYKSFSFLKYI